MRSFNNEEWIDVSSEEYREYYLTGGTTYLISNPQKFFISSTGTHFILDSAGVVHTIQNTKYTVLKFLDRNGLSFVEPSVKTQNTTK